MAQFKKQAGHFLSGLGLKKKALKVYFFFFNGRKDLIDAGRKKLMPILAARRSANGIYAIDLDSDWIGLGARIVKTLEILLYCDERGLTPLIKFNYREDTVEKPDYFRELFSYKLMEPAVFTKARFTNIRDTDELGWPEDYNTKLRLDIARPLFEKYLRINPEILVEVDLFCGQYFKGNKMLGLHYRGTDKAGEAPLVAKEDLLSRIKSTFSENPWLQAIFVSTDDEAILSFLERSDLPVPVISRQDAVRSKDGQQFHRKTEISKSVVNRDAIVNMLILSRCDFLLKTASILSDCSIIFNPAIKVRVISFPHSENVTWWPATEINKSQESLK